MPLSQIRGGLHFDFGLFQAVNPIEVGIRSIFPHLSQKHFDFRQNRIFGTGLAVSKVAVNPSFF